MRGPRRTARQVRALARVSRAAARAYGCHPLRVARIARRVRSRMGWEYDEALRIGVLDPRMPEAERAMYVSRHANLEAQARLNNGNEVPAITGDKGVFYRYCAALGIPAPRLFGILDMRGSGWGEPGRVIDGPEAFARWVEDDLPSTFVVKPAEGYAGRGVRVLERRGDALVDPAGVALSPAGLWDALAADPEFAVWVIQERLMNHPALERLGGAGSLHTLRICTLVRRDGSVEPLFAFLKLALAGGASDNFQGGATGNGLAEIDMADGRLGPLLVVGPGEVSIGRVCDSPLTGARVEGASLPGWDAALRLVEAAAPHFLPSRALGWDVALTPGGPVLVETNTRWLPLPLPSARAVQQRLLAEAAGGAP